MSIEEPVGPASPGMKKGAPAWDARLITNCRKLRYLFEQLAPQARHAPQLRQRLRLDLADALPTDAQLLAYLAERPLVSAVEAKPQSQHLTLARMQLIERGLQ